MASNSPLSQCICGEASLKYSHLRTPRRDRNLARPRQVAPFIMKLDRQSGKSITSNMKSPYSGSMWREERGVEGIACDMCLHTNVHKTCQRCGLQYSIHFRYAFLEWRYRVVALVSLPRAVLSNEGGRRPRRHQICTQQET